MQAPKTFQLQLPFKLVIANSLKLQLHWLEANKIQLHPETNATDNKTL